MIPFTWVLVWCQAATACEINLGRRQKRLPLSLSLSLSIYIYIYICIYIYMYIRLWGQSLCSCSGCNNAPQVTTSLESCYEFIRPRNGIRFVAERNERVRNEPPTDLLIFRIARSLFILILLLSLFSSGLTKERKRSCLVTVLTRGLTVDFSSFLFLFIYFCSFWRINFQGSLGFFFKSLDSLLIFSPSSGLTKKGRNNVPVKDRLKYD